MGVMNSESPSTTSEISYKISTLRFQTLGTYIFSILHEDFSFLSHTLHYPAAPRGGDGYAAISKQVIVYFANYPYSKFSELYTMGEDDGDRET